MDCKLINRQQLPASRWQQDDTPCFVPFPNQSLKYWITTLIVAMMSIVGAWATDVSFDVKDGYASQYNDYLGQVVNVTLTNRTFTAGEWQGVCFPFSANKAQLDDTFGENGYTIEEFSSFDGSKISFSIMQNPSVVAGTPYIIKVKTTVENPVFNGVTFASSLAADDTNIGSQDDNGHITISNELSFRGYFFKKDAAYILVGSQSSPVTAYWLKTDGTLINQRVWPGGGEFPTDYYGTGAYFFSATLGNTMLTISLEVPSGGGGDTPVDPSTMTLQQKIEARMQLTDLPTIYIGLPEIGNQSINEYLYKNRSTFEAPYRPATIKVIATSDTSSPHYLESFEETNPLDLEIKVRGNSTSAPDKRPYRLKFAKKGASSDGKAHKHDLLGKGYSKRNWTLLANHFDRTLLRNAIMYHLGTALGMDFNPGYKFVDLVINNEYRGTYQVSDQCEVDGDRINIDEDTGWFVEAARADMVEEPKITAADATWEIKNPEIEDPTQLEEFKTEVTNWLNTWGAAMNKDNSYFMSNIKGWRAYSDEDSFVKFYLGINLTGDYDGFMTVKAYREADGKLFLGPIWDKDLAFGNYTGDNGETLVENFENGQLRWRMAGLLTDPLFVKKLKAKMDELDAANITKTLCDKVDELSELIESSRVLNYQTWPITLQDAWGVNATSENYADYTNALKAYLTQHIAFIKQSIDNTYATVCTPENATYNPENDWTSHGMTLKKILNQTVVNRTLAGGKWNTFCLPFSATQAQMESALGCKYELKVHSGIDADGETMLFMAPESLDIIGGFPYLIKPVSDVSSMTFTDVVNTEVPNNSIPYNGEGVTFDNKHFFYGTLFQASYLNTTTDFGFTSDLYNLGDNLSNVSSTSIKGARAFIRNIDGTTPKIAFESTTPPVVRTQLTTLPTIYIDTQDGVEVQSSVGEWVAAGIQVIDAKGNLKPFTQEIGLTSAGKNILQIRGRGTTSWTNTDKKSYRLQFGKDEKDDLGNVTTSYKHNLMVNEDGAGVVKKRNWVLLANSGDKTLVRNALTKEIGDIVGLPFTPDYMFVDLVLNGTYVGTYQVTEFLEADPERVPVDEDNGLLIQMTGSTDADLTNDHVISGADYTKPYLTIKNPEVKAKNQATWNEAFNSAVYDFNGMWEANDGTGLNKESLVNWYIASEIIGDYEALSSIYAYKDVNATELSFGPLWGTETAYDNNASITMTSAGLMSDLDDNSTHTGLMTKAGKQSAWQTKIEGLWAQPWFANAVRLRWNTLYNNGALTTTLKDKVTTLAGIVNATDETFTTSSQAKNFTATAGGGAGWTIAGQGITNYSKSVASEATFASEVERLQGYFDTRLPYLEKKFKAMDNTVEYDVTRSDAKTYYAGYNTLTTNVILKNRGTITSSYWNPITFPFNANEDKMKEVFGNEFQLEQFSSVESQGDKVSVLKFTKVSPKAVTAGTPYLIKPASDVNLDEKTFSNVTFNSSDEGSTTATEGYTYVGLLQPKTFSADKTHLFVGKNNTFVRLSGSATLTGARAYFTIPEAAYSKKFNLGSFDDITGISNVIIQTDADNSKIYNLNGQMVGTNWNTLPQGVYIVNGKKIVK